MREKHAGEIGYKRLLDEFEKLDVQVNLDKTRTVGLTQDQTFSFLGFDYRRVKTLRGVWGGLAYFLPSVKSKLIAANTGFSLC